MRRLLTDVRYLVPTAFTLGNIFCGCYAVVSSISASQSSNPDQAAALFLRAAEAIGLAVVLDNIDGRIARTIGACSDFGTDLDSFADVLTFGGSAAVLAYLWIDAGEQARTVSFAVGFVFVACGAMRLVRSNLRTRRLAQPDNSARPQHESFFVGLPIPAAAAVIAAFVYFSSIRSATVILPIWLLLAILMVSPVKYSKLQIKGRNDGSIRALLDRLIFPALAIVIFASVWLGLRWVVLLAVLTYAAHGPVVAVLRLGEGKSTETLLESAHTDT